MNNQLKISESGANLPYILERLEEGSAQEIVITRDGKAIAKVSLYNESQVHPLRGLPIVLSDDFNEPMSEVWEALKV